MSRSYTVLAASLVGVAGLIGIAQLTMSNDDSNREPTVAAAQALVEVPVDPPVDPPADPLGESAEPMEGPAIESDAERAEEASNVDVDCTLSIRLQVGMTDPEVACLEAQLIAAGMLQGVEPDDVFDTATEAAVEAFQKANALVVDGVVGPQTAGRLGSWVGPAVLPPNPDTCAAAGRSAVVDRFNQRAWLCEDGSITLEMPITSAISQPDPGTYRVYAKDMNASSTLSGEYSTMTHFVAFTHGKYQGARIAFHSVPKYSNGQFVQPLDSVGNPAWHGDSSGCIRVLPDDAERIWRWLDVGDTVTVVT